MPNPSPEQDSRPTAEPGSRLAGAVRSPAGIGIVAVAVLAGVIAVGGLLGGVGRPDGNAAAASPSSSAVALASASPVPPSVAAPGTPSASPSPTLPGASAPASASPSVGTSASPSIGPSATPTVRPSATPVASPHPTPSATSSDGIPAHALQARLDKMRKKLKMPGVSVAIVWDDGRRWLGASGFRNVRAKDPMTTGTGFALASVSKTLTAAVVLQLVGEGRLSLGQRVAPLLPAFDLDPRITVRMLLDHTSGLPDFFLNAKIDRPLQAAPDTAWTAKRTWTYVPVKRPRPGKLWMYSNSNYLVLGELVKAVTGRPLATEIRERLIDPLALETMWFQDAEKPRVKGTLSYRLVAKPGGGVRFVPVATTTAVMPFRSVVTAAGGAGSIASTALDAARWMQAFAGGQVLTPTMQRAMVGDVARTAKLRPRIPYGLGIQARPIAGRYALGHSGRFLGFRNVVRYIPSEGVTIAVLTNQGVNDPSLIAEELLRIVLPPLRAGSPSPKP